MTGVISMYRTIIWNISGISLVTDTSLLIEKDEHYGY